MCSLLGTSPQPVSTDLRCAGSGSPGLSYVSTHVCTMACTPPMLALPVPAAVPAPVPAAASSFNLGNTATLYLAIDTSSLNSITGTTFTPGTSTSLNSLVRISPPDQAPPTSPPGMTISQTTTYNYNLIISKLLTCVNERSVRCKHL